MINETAVRNFNIEDPLTCVFIKPEADKEENTLLPLIGVMRNIHIEPLKSEVLPYMMRIRSRNWGWVPYLSIRLETHNYKSVMDRVERTWNEFTAGLPLRKFFLDDDYYSYFKVSTGF